MAPVFEVYSNFVLIGLPEPSPNGIVKCGWNFHGTGRELGMLTGAFALLERSLRVDARAWATHLVRLGLVIAIYFSLCFAELTASNFGAPGLRFFQSIAYLDAIFMTLLGIGFFSTIITEEKEEDTLGLMLMAGISPLGLLLGKSVGRLWQSLLLVAIQYPFVLLAVTLGGITADQIWSVVIALLAYMIFLAGLGLLCSTLAPRSQTAGAWMTFGLFLYFLVPSLAQYFSAWHSKWLLEESIVLDTWKTWWMFIHWVSESCAFLELGNILSTGFRQTSLSAQVLSNTTGGVICALIAWFCFGVATRNPTTEAVGRGLVTRHRWFSILHAGRTWNNCFIWKDFYFTSGGIAALLVRCAYYTTLGLISLEIELSKLQMWAGVGDGCLFLMWVSVPIDAARVVARAYQHEIRGQTLASLMMLPRSVVYVVYSKTAGVLMCWLPALIITVGLSLCSPGFCENILRLPFNQESGWLILSMIFLFGAQIPFFAALIALYVRWGAVVLAIGLVIGIYIGLMMALSVLAMFLQSTGVNFGGEGIEFLMLGGMNLVFFINCLLSHLAVLFRLRALGAK